MKVTLADIIQSVCILPQDVLEEVVQRFQHSEYPKNYSLLKPGEPFKHLWSMTKGTVRYFYNNGNGKEINTWFGLGTGVITDAPCLVTPIRKQKSLLILNLE